MIVPAEIHPYPSSRRSTEQASRDEQSQQTEPSPPSKEGPQPVVPSRHEACLHRSPCVHLSALDSADVPNRCNRATRPTTAAIRWRSSKYSRRTDSRRSVYSEPRPCPCCRGLRSSFHAPPHREGRVRTARNSLVGHTTQDATIRLSTCLSTDICRIALSDVSRQASKHMARKLTREILRRVCVR